MTRDGVRGERAWARIRPARAHDAVALERLHTRTWREAYWGALPDRVAATGLYDAAAWRATIARTRSPQGRDAAVLVAEGGGDAPKAEGGLLGFTVVGPASSAQNPGRRLGRDDPSSRRWASEVFMLYVLAAAQRRGVGRDLLRGCARHAGARGLFTLGLWCVADNQPARAFYEAQGGQPAGTRLHTVRGATTPVVGYRWDETGILELINGGSRHGVE